MAAIAPGDEIQAAAGHRVQGGMDRLAADHGDRRRRQAGNHVGVIGVGFLEVRAGQLAGVALAQAVDHRRVGLQQHADFQAAHEHPGDLAALLRHTGFLFYQGGHDQRLVRVGIRCIGGALAPFLGQYIIQAVVGFFQEFDIGHAAHEAVGVRKESPFGKHARVAELVHHFVVAKPRQGLHDLFVFGQR